MKFYCSKGEPFLSLESIMNCGRLCGPSLAKTIGDYFPERFSKETGYSFRTSYDYGFFLLYALICYRFNLHAKEDCCSDCPI